MAIVHATQALFLAKQLYSPRGVGLGLSTVSSDRRPVHDCMHIL